MEEITKKLFSLRDGKYADFHSSLVPTAGKERIIGVRSPLLRAYAKELIKSGKAEAFLAELPHEYLDENTLHSMILASEKKDIERAIYEVERFLPCVDNWATCDVLVPDVFRKYPEKVYPKVKEWLASPHTYTKRFALVVMLSDFLDENFKPEMLELPLAIESGDYYVDMAVAWYYSFALIKRYEETIPYFENRRMDEWLHNKSIQKALESFRVPEERKNYLRSLKV